MSHSYNKAKKRRRHDKAGLVKMGSHFRRPTFGEKVRIIYGRGDYVLGKEGLIDAKENLRTEAGLEPAAE